MIEQGPPRHALAPASRTSTAMVAAPTLADRMQRLVNVADEVDGVSQHVPRQVVGWRKSKGHLQALQLGDDAVAFR
jgi:hypothetical protein